MVKEAIKKQITGVLSGLGIENPSASIEIPSDTEHGDYSSNVGLVYAKKLKKNPMEVAERIAQLCRGKKSFALAFGKIEAVRPGFINFYLSKEYLIQEIEGALKSQEKIGEGIALKGKKIMVEFTDPNPFKEFHIGHLYSNTVGESLCRLMESQGAEVKRVCYQGDVGLHVAKAIWGMEEHIKNKKSNIKNIEERSLDKRIQFLGESYAYGEKNMKMMRRQRMKLLSLIKWCIQKKMGRYISFTMRGENGV